MDIKHTFKPLMLTIFLLIPLMIGNASMGYAGGPLSPPPGNFILAKSKAVDGLLSAVIVDSDGGSPYVVQYIVVMCKEAEIVLGPAINDYSTPETLPLTTAECSDDNESCLEGLILVDTANPDPNVPSAAPCFPEAYEPPGNNKDLIISRVRNFINTGTTLSAEVTLQLGLFQGGDF